MPFDFLDNFIARTSHIRVPNLFELTCREQYDTPDNTGNCIWHSAQHSKQCEWIAVIRLGQRQRVINLMYVHGTCFKRNHFYCHGNSTVINFSRLKKIWIFTFLQDLHINNRMWMANALWPRVESLYNRKYFHCITDHILSIQTNHTCTNKWHILEKKTKSEWVVRKIVLFHGKTNDKTIHMGNSNSNSSSQLERKNAAPELLWDKVWSRTSEL